ncbi:hypothetical protein ABZZ74_51730 [Streptomyces sp. NPDC006476]|uniref:hypothetical protein n=1 Tax=Streptomyces sp. NPDC006476 TaxID=3157175 RepID=UPI0033B767A2
MPQLKSPPTARTADAFLLFAHEAYYPGPGTQEINTTVVAADSLLHPEVCQPDGARIHALLTRPGREPGAVVPLATLTHEMGGGASWPDIGDWESVIAGLVQLVRTGRCDALGLGLGEIARCLVCTGPHGSVRTRGPHGDVIVYGSSERTAVLAYISGYLDHLAAEQPFWPGNDLLPPTIGHA